MLPVHDVVVPSNILYYIPVSTFLSIWDQFNFIEIMEVLFSIYMIKYVDITFNNILVYNARFQHYSLYQTHDGW
jgi:hypothetical protein